VIMGLSRDLRVVGLGRTRHVVRRVGVCDQSLERAALCAEPGRHRLEAYDVAAFAERFGRPSQWGRELDVQRASHADIRLRTPAGANDGEGMQGVAFSANGRIYVTRAGDRPYVNRIFVYNALTGRRFGVARVWNFPGDSDEIEGIECPPVGCALRRRQRQ
jgi:hypothetical protein